MSCPIPYQAVEIRNLKNGENYFNTGCYGFICGSLPVHPANKAEVLNLFEWDLRRLKWQVNHDFLLRLIVHAVKELLMKPVAQT